MEGTCTTDSDLELYRPDLLVQLVRMVLMVSFHDAMGLIQERKDIRMT